MPRSTAPPPWEKPSPNKAGGHAALTAAQKVRARRRAQDAGRPYPNLVDNMAVAREAREKAK